VKHTFQCKIGHKFHLSKKDVLESNWCKICDRTFSNIVKFSTQNNGYVLQDSIDHTITFICKNKHEWTVNYKRATKSWCKYCNKDTRNNIKKQIQEENNLFEEIKKRRQGEVLKEARNKMYFQNFSQNDFEFFSKKQKESSLNDFEDNYTQLEREIDKIANTFTNKYFQNSENKEILSHEQVFHVYKILVIPEEVIRKYLSILQKTKLKQEFKRYALILHPDKNCHPEAKKAFQKIYSIIKSIIK